MWKIHSIDQLKVDSFPDKGDTESLTSKTVIGCVKKPVGLKPMSRKKEIFLQHCLNSYDNLE